MTSIDQEGQASGIAIYASPGSCSRVTMTALEEIGLDYEERVLDLAAGAQTGADYLAVNRKGKVPALLVDGRLLTENAAILAYLHAAYPEAGLLPGVGDPIATAQALGDVIWCASTLHPIVRQVRAPFKWTLGDPAGVKEDGLAKFAKECAYMSERVGEDGWWYGERWSIVDSYICWAYGVARIGGFPLGDHPRLLAHNERVRSRASVRRVLDRERAAVERHGLPIDPATL